MFNFSSDTIWSSWIVNERVYVCFRNRCPEPLPLFTRNRICYWILVIINKHRNLDFYDLAALSVYKWRSSFEDPFNPKIFDVPLDYSMKFNQTLMSLFQSWVNLMCNLGFVTLRIVSQKQRLKAFAAGIPLAQKFSDPTNDCN